MATATARGASRFSKRGRTARLNRHRGRRVSPSPTRPGLARLLWPAVLGVWFFGTCWLVVAAPTPELILLGWISLMFGWIPLLAIEVVWWVFEVLFALFGRGRGAS